MNFLPDWAPNVHPMLVHFPIALLYIAVLLDLVSLLFRKQVWLKQSAVLLFVLGAIGVGAAYLSGRQAADSLDIPALVQPFVTDHADWAWRTLLFFGFYGLIRLIIAIQKWDSKSWLSGALFVLGVVGLFLIYETADHGAELVYRFGLGTKKEAASEVSPEQSAQKAPSATNITVHETGSWNWVPGPGEGENPLEGFRWLEGSPQDVALALMEDPVQGQVLKISANDKSFLIAAGSKLKSVQAEVLINLDGFSGSFMLTHHIQGAGTYNFVALEKGVLKLGRMENNLPRIFDQSPVQVQGWAKLRAVGDGSHFRGYIDGKLFAHGHADELPPGYVGFRAAGSGDVLLKSIEVQSLRKVAEQEAPTIETEEEEGHRHEHGEDEENHESHEKEHHDSEHQN